MVSDFGKGVGMTIEARILLIFLLQDFVAQSYALITDMHRRTFNYFFNLIDPFATK